MPRLRQWEPWGHRIEFSNGVTTADLKRRRPFSNRPLGKLNRVETIIPFTELESALDVGCNSGYNSIFLATRFGMNVVGIDYNPRHIEVSRFLADCAGVRATFQQADAERFIVETKVDLVVHFGTLYHLPNPYDALRTTAKNIKPGGWLALETQLYDHPDHPNICYWMHLENEDPTNFWALSTKALVQILELTGFEFIREVSRVTPERLPRYMSRTVLVARIPEAAEDQDDHAM